MILQQILKLRQQRAKAVADARAVYETAQKEKRDSLNADEVSKYDKFIKEATDLKADVDRLERQHTLETELAGVSERDLNGNLGNGGGNDAGAEVAKRQSAAFAKFLSRGLTVLDESERRDLSVGSGTDGGFLVAPTQWVAQLIKFIDDQTFIRAKATKLTLTSAEAIGAPSLDTDISDSDWTSEVATGNKDTAMKFGKRELKPSPVAKRVLLSNKLIQRSGTPIEALVQSRLAYKFGVTEEKAFLTGNGVGKPLGLFTASADGISTARDVTCGSTTAPTGAGLIAMKYALKAAYWGKAEWLFHRDVMAKIAALTDNNGQYLWREGLRVGEADMLLGRPINMSEFTPNTLTTGLYVGLLGDFSQYWIVDALNFQVQRLVELYAETNQTGYIGRAEVDGMPVLAEAFVRGKLA